MIAKKYPLTENELRKVLQKRKPFFSYNIVANIYPNTLGYIRCGIVLSSKQTPWSVNRNTFRRHMYDVSSQYIKDLSVDVVFVIKKGVVFDRKNTEQIRDFMRDIQFLWKTIKKQGTK